MTFITVNNRSEFPMLNHDINYSNLIGRLRMIVRRLAIESHEAHGAIVQIQFPGCSKWGKRGGRVKKYT